MESLAGKRVLVIGLGESGLGAALLLRELGAQVRVTDLNCHKEILRNVELLPTTGVEVELGTHSKNFTREVDFAILSPGVSPRAPLLQWLKQDQIPIRGELEWASQFLSGKVIAITGSNGKSTTSTLLWKILREQGVDAGLAGNIGRSLSRAVLEDSPKQVWVLEVSSFQLERVGKFKPWISMLLNLTPNHLDRYPSFEDYRDAKQAIFRNQDVGDWAILNRSFSLEVEPHAKMIFVNSQGSQERGIFIQDRWIRFCLEGSGQNVLPLAEIPVKGSHDVENVMFASAAAILCDVPVQVIRRAVHQFKGLEHRQEVFGIWDGTTWVNDSKSTSVDAVRKALEAFDRPVIWIAGGRYKGGDFGSLRALVSQKVSEAHFYGEAATVLSTSLKGACPLVMHGPLENAVEEVRSRVRSGDTILFSPGCASFDQFKNFEERGAFFKKQVKDGFQLAAFRMDV